MLQLWQILISEMNFVEPHSGLLSQYNLIAIRIAAAVCARPLGFSAETIWPAAAKKVHCRKKLGH